eukprot:m.119536 g.119536  ORF g.119536 m.119536 type:complete len:96 (-) comp21799_c0_seq1:234-521(-)
MCLVIDLPGRMPEHRVEGWNLLLCPYREEGRVSYVIDLSCTMPEHRLDPENLLLFPVRAEEEKYSRVSYLQEEAPSDQPAEDRHPRHFQTRAHEL